MLTAIGIFLFVYGLGTGNTALWIIGLVFMMSGM